jgi:hypothetical protein
VQAPPGRVRGILEWAVISLINAPARIRTRDLWLWYHIELHAPTSSTQKLKLIGKGGQFTYTSTVPTPPPHAGPGAAAAAPGTREATASSPLPLAHTGSLHLQMTILAVDSLTRHFWYRDAIMPHPVAYSGPCRAARCVPNATSYVNVA